MIKIQMALIKRELLEHRAIYVTPLVLGLIICLLYVTGQASISAFDKAIDIAILGASNIGEQERGAAISAGLVITSSLFVFPMLILGSFYVLDSLYAERKDRSILFWRSLPITDAETVVSKLITALVVIPLATFLLLIVTHVVVLTISSIWVGLRGGDGWRLVWGAAPLLDNWSVTLIFFLALPLWLSPFVGWFLFVSTITRRTPLLMAFLPIIILPMLERIFLRSSLFAEAFFERTVKMPLLSGIDPAKLVLDDSREMQALAASGIDLLSLVDVAAYLSSPSLWLGIAVCGLFTAAAIYVRRYRDDTWL